MKTIMNLLICMIFSVASFGQNRQGGFVEELVVNQPKFTGVSGVVSLYNGNTANISQYVADNIDLTNNRTCSEGTEIIKFTVTQNGELTDFKVINSVDSKIDQQVINVLKGTDGMWVPGMSDGNPVSMEKEIAIYFANCKETASAYDVFTNFKESATIAFNKGNEKFIVQGKPKQALRKYDEGIRYLPNDQALLVMRGMCLYELGDIEGAKEDWTKLYLKGGVDFINAFAENYKNLKGYDELMKLANK